jgi:hypothetical protein
MARGIPPLARHYHAVQFYAHDADLYETVATFISEGLIAGEPAIVVATCAHAVEITNHLQEKLIDVAAARRIGDLVMLDAEESLSTFMIGGMPDPRLFSRVIGTVIEQSVRGRERTRVRAYGEMVDVLWKKGQPDAAIRLEALWNELATHHSFALLCGYALGGFQRQTARFEDVCRQHTHVTVPESHRLRFDLPRTRAH